MNEVLDFISHFHKISKTNDIDEVFTCGCCYWFAYILCGRFQEAEMMYDPVSNHFMVGYGGRLYDITGDVTDKYNATAWKDFEDELERQRIVDYCIHFSK